MSSVESLCVKHMWHIKNSQMSSEVYLFPIRSLRLLTRGEQVNDIFTQELKTAHAVL